MSFRARAGIGSVGDLDMDALRNGLFGKADFALVEQLFGRVITLERKVKALEDDVLGLRGRLA